MRAVVVGAHLDRGDVEPVAEALPAGDLWLSAVAVAEDQPLGDRELLVRVAGVRNALLERATFIAIRYGLTVSDPAAAKARVAAHLDRWQRLLTAHREHVEILLKTTAAVSQARPDRSDFASGAAYLRALHESARATQADPLLRDAAGELLLPLTVQHRWVRRDGKSLELAMLVRRDAVETVRRAGDALRIRVAGVPFLLSGPWPLEVFADDHHE